MKSVKQLKFKIRLTGGGGLFHDSRSDVKTLTKALKLTADKVNELVQVVNEQSKEIENLKDQIKQGVRDE